MASVRGWVSGRVQGVGFRYFVKRQADAAGLSGFVRNLPDGRVEFQLQGAGEIVDAVIDEIRVGPRFSKVSEVILDESPVESAAAGFLIR